MWMTISELAGYLKISKETIYKMVQKNEIPASKLGSQWRFDKEQIDTWLKSKSNQNTKDSEVSNG